MRARIPGNSVRGMGRLLAAWPLARTRAPPTKSLATQAFYREIRERDIGILL